MAQANVIAPRLPNPPKEYTQAYMEQLLRVMFLYFNQLDNPGPISGATRFLPVVFLRAAWILSII